MRWRWRKGSQRLSHMRCGRNEAGECDCRNSPDLITSPKNLKKKTSRLERIMFSTVKSCKLLVFLGLALCLLLPVPR